LERENHYWQKGWSTRLRNAGAHTRRNARQVTDDGEIDA
jgi:hypothetical protein